MVWSWATSRVVRSQEQARQEREQNIIDVHRRIDEAERAQDEQREILERNLIEMINTVQQELIRENASLLARLSPKK